MLPLFAPKIINMLIIIENVFLSGEKQVFSNFNDQQPLNGWRLYYLVDSLIWRCFSCWSSWKEGRRSSKLSLRGD